MKNEKSPKEVIESVEKPYLEHLWIKYPGEKMADANTWQTIGMAHIDLKKIEKIVQEHGGRKFTSVHNHPNFALFLKSFFSTKPLPSHYDIDHFSGDAHAKTMVIAQNNAYTGELEGYGVYRKTKQTKAEKPNLLQKLAYGLADTLFLGRQALDYYADKFGIRYRFVPAKGYEFNGNRFVKSESKSLEGKTAAAAIIIILLSSIFFLPPKLTGEAIGDLSLKTSNLLGIILFLSGIAVGLVYFNKKLSKRTKRIINP
jgi:hypothetical protein